MTLTDKINAANEANYGKIKKCCDMYQQYCRCSKLNKIHVKGIDFESSYAMKIENSKAFTTIWGMQTLKRESNMELNDKKISESIFNQAKHLPEKEYPNDQGLNLSQEFIDSIGADFRRNLNKKTFLQRLIFWK